MQDWCFATVCRHAPCRSLTRCHFPARLSRATRSRLQPLDGPRSSFANRSSLVVRSTRRPCARPPVQRHFAARLAGATRSQLHSRGGQPSEPVSRLLSQRCSSLAVWSRATRSRLVVRPQGRLSPPLRQPSTHQPLVTTPNGVTSDRQPLARLVAAVCRSPPDRGPPNSRSSSG